MKPGPGALAFAGGALLWFLLSNQEPQLLAVLSNPHPFTQKLTELPTPIRLFLLALTIAFLDVLGFRVIANGLVMLAIGVWILRFASRAGVGGTALSSAINHPLKLSGGPTAPATATA